MFMICRSQTLRHPQRPFKISSGYSSVSFLCCFSLSLIHILPDLNLFFNLLFSFLFFWLCWRHPLDLHLLSTACVRSIFETPPMQDHMNSISLWYLSHTLFQSSIISFGFFSLSFCFLSFHLPPLSLLTFWTELHHLGLLRDANKLAWPRHCQR